MAKNYQISYIIEAVDKATATLNAIEKKFDSMDKARERSSKRNSVSAAAVISNYKKEQAQVSKLRKDYVNFWTSQMNSRDKDVISQQRSREKARRFEEREIYNKRKNEVLYTDFWNQELNKRDRIANQSIRRQERIRSQNYHSVYHGSRAAMMTVAAPTAAMGALSLRNAMQVEQMKIGLSTRFGNESEKVMKDAVSYATSNALSIQDVIQLINGLKSGSKNVGIQGTDQLLRVSKDIGNVMLAFTSNQEQRSESINQLRQIALKGNADFRQDIQVLESNNIPIIQALEKYSGKSFAQLQADVKARTGSNKIEARTIYQALINLSQADDVVRSINERSKSLTQSWDSLKETAFLASASYGNILNDQFGIEDKMRSISKSMLSFALQSVNGDKKTRDMKDNMIGFGSALLIGTPIMMTLISLAGMLATRVGGSAALMNLFSRNLFRSVGVMSAIYLTTVDWDDVMKDINEKGFKGFAEHLDIVAASASALLLTLTSIKSASTFIAGLSVAGVAGVATGGAALAGYGGYKLGESFSGSTLEDAILNKYYENQERMTGVKSLSIIDPEIRRRNEERMAKEKEVNLQVTNNIQVDKLGNVKSQTVANHKKNRDPFLNSLTYQMGD